MTKKYYWRCHWDNGKGGYDPDYEGCRSTGKLCNTAKSAAEKGIEHSELHSYGNSGHHIGVFEKNGKKEKYIGTPSEILYSLIPEKEKKPFITGDGAGIKLGEKYWYVHPSIKDDRYFLIDRVNTVCEEKDEEKETYLLLNDGNCFSKPKLYSNECDRLFVSFSKAKTNCVDRVFNQLKSIALRLKMIDENNILIRPTVKEFFGKAK